MSFRKTHGVFVLLVLLGTVAQNAFAVEAATVGTIESFADSTTFEVDIPLPGMDTVVVGADTFTRLTLPGAYPALLDSGKPEVLSVTVMLAVPEGGSPVTCTVVEKEDTVLDVGKAYPQQPLLDCCEDSADFVYDTAFYRQQCTAYPDTDVAILSDGHWRQLRVVNIVVYPLRVNPVRRTVVAATHLRVRVDHNYGVAVTNVLPQWMVPLYRRVVDNFSQVPYTCDDYLPYTPGTRCLVISHSRYGGTKLPQLADWIHRRGYETKVVYDAVSEPSKEHIKDIIQTEYNNGGKTPVLHWVLLVGNAHTDQLEIPNSGAPPYRKGDYGYTLLTDDYDSLPDIGIARITPRDEADLDSIIDKILAYEKTPPACDWLNRLDFGLFALSCG